MCLKKKIFYWYCGKFFFNFFNTRLLFSNFNPIGQYSTHVNSDKKLLFLKISKYSLGDSFENKSFLTKIPPPHLHLAHIQNYQYFFQHICYSLLYPIIND